MINRRFVLFFLLSSDSSLNKSNATILLYSPIDCGPMKPQDRAEVYVTMQPPSAECICSRLEIIDSNHSLNRENW